MINRVSTAAPFQNSITWGEILKPDACILCWTDHCQCGKSVIDGTRTSMPWPAPTHTDWWLVQPILYYLSLGGKYFLLCWYGTDKYFLHCLICIRLREVFNKHILQEIIYTDPWELVKWCTLTKRTYWNWVKMSTHMSRWWQNLDNLENWLKNAFASYGWVTCCLCQIKLTKQTESELVYAWDITALHLRECK